MSVVVIPALGEAYRQVLQRYSRVQAVLHQRCQQLILAEQLSLTAACVSPAVLIAINFKTVFVRITNMVVFC